ncbi:5'-nucleotidase [Formivibrio citricus]|uniref:5'-nucleotidase n=1 Tax=Formivibrio citricus TaxID=83765 RepID=A0A1I4Z3I6_9NEIS|nr:5'-nucleotidase [Formivibrio citricus]SFN44831.1 5'-nucleotidase [Formivibrio citricus]
MPYTLDGKLVVAVSSRALFDFEEANQVFEAQDEAAYMAYQMARLDEPAHPGVAFPLIQKLLRFNSEEEQRVEVVILSSNDPASGLRVFRSAEKHGLHLERGVFTRGRSPFGFLEALHANLFLSAHKEDVRSALSMGFPAAQVYPGSQGNSLNHPDEIRIAFDGDAVLFSDEAERVFQKEGLPAFQQHEHDKALHPLPPGPFKTFLEALHRLQKETRQTSMRIRTALVTARSAPAHERAIRTLMNWNIQVDEAMFLGGLEKGPFLAQFEPDFFFDDQVGHCQSASQIAPTGLVVNGVVHDAR